MRAGAVHTIRDTWNFYRENREYETKIKDDEYAKICTAFFKLLMEKVLDGHVVTLPFKLGSVYVRGVKYKIEQDENGNFKKINISWGKTRKMWEEVAKGMGLTLKEYMATVPPQERKLIYSFNENTGGYTYKIIWDKTEALAYNRHLYTLVFAKDNKRALHKKILSGKEYILKN